MPFERLVELVRTCVAEVLAIDPAGITPQSRLMDDLGADSLDLVELMYLFEQKLEIRLGERDISLSAQLGLSEDETHDHEVLTPKALTLLRERFPNAQEILKDGISRRHLAALLTVEEVARMLQHKLEDGTPPAEP
jgi:acyl carrier protein